MTRVRSIDECRVLCTPTTFGKRDPSLKSTLEESVREVIYNPFGRPLKADDLCPIVADVDGYIAGVDEVDASVIQAADRLQVIARYGVGVDRVDIAQATARSIVVTNTPGANSAAVAELTISLMLALARHIIVASEGVRRGDWPTLDGVGIRGKTIGLIGFGSVAREVAHRLQGFGCLVLAYDPYVGQDKAEKYGVRMVPLDTLLPHADFVSLHAPANDSTTGMVNDKFLRLTKRGAFLINTARGELLDEPALVAALESGHLQGAALDCFSQEPPGTDGRLLQLSQVIATPHMAAHTDEAINQMGWMALRSCLAALRGEQPSHVVNPEVYDKRFREESDVGP
jgi:D-3-phosphoglycerate dehydrogenase